ncbi:hypothetical protein DPMN_088960 [Dreissena polymorpha]|uniref:Uncharacterized protein n=1 Tax=Dreissena polymorpha TaxID=45954 RepID=A0A9D4QXL0_DREPO|nr:hypothetical protein DPMN_088960 [Dreissena polymorpha]
MLTGSHVFNELELSLYSMEIKTKFRPGFIYKIQLQLCLLEVAMFFSGTEQLSNSAEKRFHHSRIMKTAHDGHVFQRTRTISHKYNNNVLGKFHEDWTEKVTTHDG